MLQHIEKGEVPQLSSITPHHPSGCLPSTFTKSSEGFCCSICSSRYSCGLTALIDLKFGAGPYHSVKHETRYSILIIWFQWDQHGWTPSQHQSRSISIQILRRYFLNPCCHTPIILPDEEGMAGSIGNVFQHIWNYSQFGLSATSHISHGGSSGWSGLGSLQFIPCCHGRIRTWLATGSLVLYLHAMEKVSKDSSLGVSTYEPKLLRSARFWRNNHHVGPPR